MTKKEFIFVLIATLLFGFVIQSNAEDKAVQPTTSTQPSIVSLSISGTIKNFDEFVARVTTNTYIQLVPIDTNGSYQVATDSKGQYFGNPISRSCPCQRRQCSALTCPTLHPVGTSSLRKD